MAFVSDPIRLARFVLCALAFLAFPRLDAAPPVVPTDVRHRAQQRVDFGYTPGIVIGIINPEGRAFFSYGNRSWTDPTPTDSATLYEIGSVTKTFTGVLLAQMEEAGDVTFNDLVSTHLPPGTAMPANGGETITLEHLAAQRSGLPAGIANLPATITDPGNPFSNYTSADIYNFLASFTLPRAPGAAFEYSNFGIGLLGHALALSQGQSYESLLTDRVLTPLGLTDTAITLTPAQEARRAPAHGGYIERPEFDMNSLAAAGGLFSTADDLLTYVEHNMSLVPGGPLNAAMAESHLSRGNSGDPIIDIGLAWWRWDLSDTHIQHGGDTIGSTAFIGFRPATSTGVVVLSNARGHQYNTTIDLGFHSLIPLYPLSTITPPATLPVADRHAYVGHYTDGSVVIDVGLVHDELTIISGGLETTAYARGSHKFTLYEATANADFTFNFDGTGKVVSVTLVQPGTMLTLPRVRRDPLLEITRSGSDLLLNLTGEGDQTYQLESSLDGDTWTPLLTHTIWDPPYQQAPIPGPILFRSHEVPARP